jgi:hypothetical protein
MKIDLHHLNVNDAIRIFIEKYNENYKKEEKIEVIHGYGSGGKGGKIKKEFQKFIKQNNKFLKYEIPLNPGATYIYPKKMLPPYKNSLEIEIFEFCNSPKSLSKIERKFLKKYTIQEIKSSVKKLTKTNQLVETLKNSTIVYIQKS